MCVSVVRRAATDNREGYPLDFPITRRFSRHLRIPTSDFLLEAPIVDFDHANASTVVQAGEQCSVRARRKRRGYAGLQWAGWRKTRVISSAAWAALSCQSLFAMRSAPLLSRSSSVGSARGSDTPRAARLGPMPRTTILSFPL